MRNWKYQGEEWVRGGVSVLVLILGLTASVAMGGLVLVTTSEYSYTKRDLAAEQALAIAEAGINYYRWHLAHNPDDYTDGTGEPGPYVHDYHDPEGKKIGEYSLTIEPPEEGSSVVAITATGKTSEYPGVKRTIRARFGIPSLARYSFLHNANVWFGSGLTVHGRVLSNGGIRQDGVNDSVIQSAKETYTCGTETGCNPSQERPGVWGAGGPSDLWEYPVPQIDFDSISVDFNSMKNAAISNGTYYGPTSNPGYHFVFEDTGVVQVYEVLSTNNQRGYDDDSCQNLYQQIGSENLIATIPLQGQVILFAEDTVWVEGKVNGRATLVAARFPIDTYNESMWIIDNVEYLAYDGNHSLGLIAQNNIYLGRDVPEHFVIDAALLAQKGKIVRHHYAVWWCSGFFTSGFAVKDSLTIFGSVISNQKSYWNWGSSPSSGFVTRDVSYDGRLYLTPPPYFPESGEYEFITWDEDVNP